MEVSQRWALPQPSCKTFYPSLADPIVLEIEVSERCALRQHSWKDVCPSDWSNLIVAEI